MNKINLKPYLIELIVVFIGIYAAFLLNNWRENKQDVKLEMKYLNTIANEVLLDSENLKSILDENGKKLNKLAKYISKIDSGGSPKDSALILLGDMLSIVLFYPRVSTYESMKYSGNLNLIRYYDLREKLVSYYESFDEYKLQQQLSVDFIYDYVAKFVFDKIDLSKNRIIDNNQVKMSSLNNLILAYYTFLRQNVRNQKTISEENKKLQTILNEYLHK